MRRVALLLLMLTVAREARCGVGSGYQVKVRFISMNGHTRDVFIPLDEREGRKLHFNPRDARRFVLEARRRYAEQLGFQRRIYGEDHWKIVPGLRVEVVKLNLPTGGSVDIP